MPKQYKQIQNMTLLTELIWRIIMMPSETYPKSIHFPTGIFPKSLVESATPVNAPSGESNKESPRLASVKANRCLIPGIAATQVPNNKLEAENKKPTANAGFNFMKEEMFLIIDYKRSAP
jgi:hypothetical protein